VTINKLLQRISTLAMFAIILGACASGPKITRLTPLSESAGAPYGNILVLSLFKSFDNRRYLEQEIVKQLEDRGIKAVAMTSLADSRTPVNRKTLLELVERTNADAVLVTQIISFDTSSKSTDMRPQATYNIRPTYYYDVFSVELTEYVEPAIIQHRHDVALETDLFSADSQEKVWAIASERQVTEGLDRFGDYSVFVDEAKAIVRAMSSDKLIKR